MRVASRRKQSARSAVDGPELSDKTIMCCGGAWGCTARKGSGSGLRAGVHYAHSQEGSAERLAAAGTPAASTAPLRLRAARFSFAAKSGTRLSPEGQPPCAA